MKKKWMSLCRLVGLFILALFTHIDATAAQTAAFTGTTDAYADEWYMQPWVWILSAGIFVLLFTMILSREDNRDA